MKRKIDLNELVSNAVVRIFCQILELYHSIYLTYVHVIFVFSHFRLYLKLILKAYLWVLMTQYQERQRLDCPCTRNEVTSNGYNVVLT